MTSWFQRSLAKTRGLRPVLIMLALLLGSEAALHWGPVDDAVTSATDRLWLDRWVGARLEEVMPNYQVVSEEAMTEAYFRAIRKSPAQVKVLVMGDSEVALAPGGVSFARALKPAVAEAFPGAEVGVYCLATRGMDPVQGFYLLKRALAAVNPDLVILVTNSYFFGEVYHNLWRRDVGYFNRDFFAPEEAAAYAQLVGSAEVMDESWTGRLPLWMARADVQLQGGSRLRALLLPPAVFGGLSSRCYFPECQGTDNVYWRDRLREIRKPGKDTIKNFKRNAIADGGVQLSYLKLMVQLGRDRGVPLVLVVPPKNFEMLELFEVDRVAHETGLDLLRVLAEEDAAVINCLDAVPERYFRGTMHLRAEGFPLWAECIRGPLPGLVRAAESRP